MRILTGVQPTNRTHIGNYLAAIRHAVDLINNTPNALGILFIADLHALTVPHNPRQLHEGIYQILATYLAAGFDYNKHIIFTQSHNPDHTYLSFILETQTPIGWLERMIQYKEKARKVQRSKQHIGTGLLTYPVLMAADILLYDTDIVPVGEDQLQHVELTRDIAERFNHLYGNTFKIPKAEIIKFGARLKDLKDPTKKMSKSDPTGKGVLFLTDDDDTIHKKIMGAVTDTDDKIHFDPEHKPGISNLLTIFALVTGKDIKQIESEYESSTYAQFKQSLSEALIEFLKPIRQQILDYTGDKAELDRILKIGAQKARTISSPKVRTVLEKLGFVLTK